MTMEVVMMMVLVMMIPTTIGMLVMLLASILPTGRGRIPTNQPSGGEKLTSMLKMAEKKSSIIISVSFRVKWDQCSHATLEACHVSPTCPLGMTRARGPHRGPPGPSMAPWLSSRIKLTF